jgi:hypothetical protein
MDSPPFVSPFSACPAGLKAALNIELAESAGPFYEAAMKEYGRFHLLPRHVSGTCGGREHEYGEASRGDDQNHFGSGASRHSS